MFKLDTHVHTAETSNCGNVAAEELVHLYKGAGYDGIVITDHYYNWYFQSLQTDTWEDKINTFLLGYNNALKTGNQVDLTVLLGMEIRFTENPNDYLVYGIDESFLLKNPELYLYTIKEFKQLAEKNELLIYQAHPFRPNLIPMPAEMLDGYEV